MFKKLINAFKNRPSCTCIVGNGERGQHTMALTRVSDCPKHGIKA